MGTTLTGTTPANTYDSLIKVTDNGPLSGTAKYLSDGLGNDSALALSTSAVGVGTSDPQTILNDFSTNARGIAISNAYPFIGFNDTDGGKFFIGTQANLGYIWNNGTSDLILATNAAERMRITAAGNVGIGTSNPVEILHIVGNQRISAVSGYSQPAILDLHGNNSSTYGGTNVSRSRIASYTEGGPYNASMRFYTNDSANALQERMRIDASGNVGIGTTSPSLKFSIGTPTGDGSQVQTYSVGTDQISLNANYVPSSPYPRFFDIVASGNADGTNGESNIRFFTNGVSSNTKTEKLRILANGGITFNGDTAAANALDDYEEGTFTPTIEGSSSTGTATYVVQSGRYTKIGNQISISIDLSWNSGTGTGALRIANLPFANISNNIAASIGFIDQIALTASNIATAYVAPSSSRIDFVQTPTGGGAVSDVTYDAAGRIIVAAVYYNS